MPIDLASGESLIVTAAAVTAIVIARYYLLSGLFAWTSRARISVSPKLAAQMRMERRYSLLGAVVYGLFTGATLWAWSALGWTKIYSDLDHYSLWWTAASVPVYLILHDAYFYWTHRWMHRPRVYRAIHYVHHKSRPPTAWAAMSFHLGESLIGAAFIPLAALALPIHVVGLGVVAGVASLLGVTNHLGYEIFPRKFVRSCLGSWFVTASHHEQHHRKHTCNYGLYFQFWDKVCSTDRGLACFSGGSR